MTNIKELQIYQSIEELERISRKLRHQLKDKGVSTELKDLDLSIKLLKEKIK